MDVDLVGQRVLCRVGDLGHGLSCLASGAGLASAVFDLLGVSPTRSGASAPEMVMPPVQDSAFAALAQCRSCCRRPTGPLCSRGSVRLAPSIVTCCGPGSCGPPPRRFQRCHRGHARDLSTRSASGVPASPPRAERAGAICPGRGVRRCSPTCRSPRSRRWPVSCPPRPGAAVAVVEHRAGRRGGRPRDRRLDHRLDRAPLARRRRDQALAAPVLDLPPRPRLRDQGRPRARPVRPHLAGTRAGRRRVRDQRRREDPIQALRRRHPPAARPGRPARSSSSTRRGGTLAYLAAYDVHHAQVFGRSRPRPASSRSPRWSTRS